MTAQATRSRGGGARSLADVVAGQNAPRAKPRPTGSAVHRYSKTAVGEEGSFWIGLPRHLRGRILQAAERYDLLGRLGERRAKSGRRIGPLGPLALDALRYLLSRMNPKTGELYPAIATIATGTGHSIGAIHAALVRLRSHGFLAWLRRFEPTGKAGLRGPQVTQASNAYRVLIPRALARDCQQSPLPDDELDRRRQDAEETRRMLASIPLDELPGEIVSDPGLVAALARLGRAIMLT